MLLALVSLLFGCDSGGPYARKGGVWRFGKEAMDVPRGEQVTPLNARFARSATRAWYRSSPIPDADAATFAVLDEHYARDSAHAWYAETYRDDQDYYLTQHVRIRRVDGADPGPLKVLADGYAVDGTHAFFEGVGFQVADAATFEPLDGGFARDRAHGYYRRQAIPGSEGAGFKVLGHNFARDSGSVFWAGMGSAGSPRVGRLAGADAGTFEGLEYDYGKDARRAYFQDAALKTDVSTFQVLDYGYAKSSQAVFYYGAPVTGADPGSFEILKPPTDSASASDRHGLYQEGRRVTSQR